MRKLTAIGNYIFAGGFTLGVEKYFEVLAHLEDGNFGTKTAQHNWPHLTIETDRALWESQAKSVLDKCPLDLLYCNPPCAAWSKAGTFVQKGRHAYKDAGHYTSCTDNALALALALRPKIWVWESVPQAWEYGREFVNGVANQLMSEGYSVTLFFTDLRLHGCPQARPRFHLIAHKVHLDEEAFSFTAKPAENVSRFLTKSGVKAVSVSPISDLRKKQVMAMQAEKKTGSLRQFVDRMTGGEYKMRKTSTGREYREGRPPFLVKLVKGDGVCETVTGGANLIHPKFPRYLSVEEQQILGGWPLSFKFQGSVNTQYAELGKAVQPATGTYVAKLCADSIKAGRRVKEPYYAILDYRPLVKGKELVYERITL